MGMTDKQAIADAYALGYAEGFANADDIFDLNEDDMEEHGWVRAERLKYREIAKENEERLLEDTLRRTISDLKDEINWLHSELHGAEMEAKKAAELKAENTRLRSCLEDAAENERLTAHEFDQLKEQRDKLRELVRDMWRELAAACTEQVTSHETFGKFSDRMNELGGEV